MSTNPQVPTDHDFGPPEPAANVEQHEFPRRPPPPNMEQDYGPTEYIESRIMEKYLLLCRSPSDKDCSYLYQRQSTKRRSDGTYTMYYRCIRCMKISSASPATVIVRDERLMRDPSIGHYEECVPFTDSEIQLLKLKRDMRRRVLSDGVRPLHAYKEAMEDLKARVDDPNQWESLEKEIGQYKQNRSALYRVAYKHSVQTGTPYQWSRNRRTIPAKRHGGDGHSGWVPQSPQSSPIRQRPQIHSAHEDEASMAIQSLEESISHTDSPMSPPPKFVNRSSLTPVSRNVTTLPAMGPSQQTHQIMLNGVLRQVRIVPASSLVNLQRLRLPDGSPRNAIGVRSPITTPRIQPRLTEQGETSASAAGGGNMFSALSKAIDIVKKKSRWENFGDYVGKTLDSLPEDHARKVSREIQQMLNREQEVVWTQNLTL